MQITTLARRLLDRPGGRALLGQLVSARAQLHGNGARIFYDECWIHQYGTDFFADWRPHTKRDLHQWLEEIRRYWFSFYTPNSGDILIDVGAGIGIESILFSRAVGDSGRVIAIEAHPRTYACLLKTCEYNSLSNVTTVNVALLDREQPVLIEDNAHHIGNAVTTGATGSLRVRGRTLDDVCDEQGIREITMIRMNIEGAEQFAIRGMQRMMPHTSYTVISCHDFKADRTGNPFFRTRKLVEEFLQDHHFSLVPMRFREPWAKDYVHAYNPRLVTNPMERS